MGLGLGHEGMVVLLLGLIGHNGALIWSSGKEKGWVFLGNGYGSGTVLGTVGVKLGLLFNPN